jgi:hypothetical protein
MKTRGQVTRWLPLVDGKAKSDHRDNQAGNRAACDDGGAARPATLSTRIWLDFLLFLLGILPDRAITLVGTQAHFSAI